MKREELERIAELSKEEQFALWYDEATDKYYFDYDAPEGAHWIFDIEQEETPEFIEEMTKVVLKMVKEICA